MLPWLVMGASALAPTAIDLLTGASKKKNSAYDAYDNEVTNQVNELGNEAGSSVTDSLMYQTGQSELDKAVKKQTENINANAASGGLTDEAKLGNTATLNEGYNTSILRLLGAASADRKRILAQKRALKLQQLGYKVNKTTEENNSQSNLSGMLSGIGMKLALNSLLPGAGLGAGTDVLPETTAGLFG